MKKTFLLTLLFTAIICNAQRFAFVDTEYILEKLPDYQRAKLKLDEKIKVWSDEIKEKEDSLSKGLRELESEKVILNEDQYKIKSEVLIDFEKEITQLKNERYGPEGDIVKLRVNLIKPIQNRIFNTVKIIAQKNNYIVVFDKSSDLVMIYSDPKTTFNITSRVLNKLNN